MININRINGTNTEAGKMGVSQTMDSVSKSIQIQIENAQKQLQELSSNKDMDMEEKMEKRQEIQKQIDDLNSQLRQRQIEQRKEKQQSKASFEMDTLNGTVKTEKRKTGLSQAGMIAMISADSAMERAQAQGRVVTQMEGRAGVLGMEIKLDANRGKSVESKQEELDEIEKRAAGVETSQMKILKEADTVMGKAAKADREKGKTENVAERKTDKEKQTEGSHDRKKEISKLIAGQEQEEISGIVSEMGIADLENIMPDLQGAIYYTISPTVGLVTSNAFPCHTWIDVRL